MASWDFPTFSEQVNLLFGVKNFKSASLVCNRRTRIAKITKRKWTMRVASREGNDEIEKRQIS